MPPEHTRLDRKFFNRPTLTVARSLIGKYIVHRQRGEREVAAMIVEVEAYKGPQDAAAHSYQGRRTPRVEPLWGDGGTVYVYLIYGMHWMLNFATAGREKPEGVLIRGVMAHDRTPIIGPGKVTRHLAINRALTGADAVVSEALWVEDRGIVVPPRHILRGPRIGIDYAGPEWAAKPWRFRVDPAFT
jgi:DNA-3-methyladenine glycosylase